MSSALVEIARNAVNKSHVNFMGSIPCGRGPCVECRVYTEFQNMSPILGNVLRAVEWMADWGEAASTSDSDKGMATESVNNLVSGAG